MTYMGNKKYIDLVHKELSYELCGILFEAYNQLGYGYPEKYYERAIIKLLTDKKIGFKNQVPYILSYRGKIIGKNFLDFLIDDKIILEIKKNQNYSRKNIEQVNKYLKITGLKLGILANFTPQGVKFMRLVNIK